MTEKQSRFKDSLAQLLAVLESRATLLAFFFGLCFVAALLVLAIWFPQPPAFQYTVFRSMLALAAAGVAGIIPGMIRLTVKQGTAQLIQAGKQETLASLRFFFQIEHQASVPSKVCILDCNAVVRDVRPSALFIYRI